jgi:hypothetical protein
MSFDSWLVSSGEAVITLKCVAALKGGQMRTLLKACRAVVRDNDTKPCPFKVRANSKPFVAAVRHFVEQESAATSELLLCSQRGH